MVNGLDFGLMPRRSRRVRLRRRPQGPPDAAGPARGRARRPRRRARGLVSSALVGHREILRDAPQGSHHLFLFGAFALLLVVILVVQMVFRLPGLPGRPSSPSALDLARRSWASTGLVRLYRAPLRREARPPGRTARGRGWRSRSCSRIFVDGLPHRGGALGGGLHRHGLVEPRGAGAGPRLAGLPRRLGQDLGPLARPPLPVLFTLATLPFGKLSHVVFGAANLFLPVGCDRREPSSPVDLENSEVFGAGQVERFTWKQLLDLEACVRCGRCQAAARPTPPARA